MVSPPDRRASGQPLRPRSSARLIELGLVREVRAKGEAPAWREDEQGRAYGLKILKAGRAAMPADEPSAAPLAQAEANGSTPQDAGLAGECIHR